MCRFPREDVGFANSFLCLTLNKANMEALHATFNGRRPFVSPCAAVQLCHCVCTLMVPVLCVPMAGTGSASASWTHLDRCDERVHGVVAWQWRVGRGSGASDSFRLVCYF